MEIGNFGESTPKEEVINHIFGLNSIVIIVLKF